VNPNERQQGELRQGKCRLRQRGYLGVLRKRESPGGVAPNGLGLFACEPDAALRDEPFLCSAALFSAHVPRAHFDQNALYCHKNVLVASFIISVNRP